MNKVEELKKEIFEKMEELMGVYMNNIVKFDNYLKANREYWKHRLSLSHCYPNWERSCLLSHLDNQYIKVLSEDDSKIRPLYDQIVDEYCASRNKELEEH